MQIKKTFDRSNYSLQDLQRRIPVVGDKALIDLVNGIQVSKDIIRYRKNRGFFGQIFEQLTGSDRTRQILLDGNLIAGQEALYNWVLELTDSLRISQLGLQITQRSLLEARNAIRTQKQILQNQEQAILLFTQQLTQLAQQIDTRFKILETRVSANEDIDRIITAWAAGQTYTNLPWAIQVALLGKEVFSSTVSIYEQETGNLRVYRDLLVNKILATSQQLPKSFFSLAQLLDSTWREMEKGDRAFCATLLEIRSIPQQRLVNTPTLFTLGTTLELATLPEDAKPIKPAESAIALCRAQIDSISRTTDVREFVTAIVEETANDCLFLMQPNQEKI